MDTTEAMIVVVMVEAVTEEEAVMVEEVMEAEGMVEEEEDMVEEVEVMAEVEVEDMVEVDTVEAAVVEVDEVMTTGTVADPALPLAVVIPLFTTTATTAERLPQQDALLLLVAERPLLAKVKALAENATEVQVQPGEAQVQKDSSLKRAVFSEFLVKSNVS